MVGRNTVQGLMTVRNKVVPGWVVFVKRHTGEPEPIGWKGRFPHQLSDKQAPLVPGHPSSFEEEITEPQGDHAAVSVNHLGRSHFVRGMTESRESRREQVLEAPSFTVS